MPEMRKVSTNQAAENKPILSHFMKHVIHCQRTTCWLWTGSVHRNGYGKFGDNRGKTSLAHKVTYEIFRGPVPEGLTLDHLCRVRHCVNPDHLEPVTQAENNRRAPNGHRAKTHCPEGHLYDAVNTRYYRGWRICRECDRVRLKRRT
jgi:HNH endonuclease